MLTDSAARWLLVLHTGLGAAAVGASTRLFLQLRRGPHLRLAWIVVALMAASFIVGAVMYPTYKVEVRAAYLENPGAVSAAAVAHDRELAHVAAREHAEPPEPTQTSTHRAAQMARWFDVKEHWVALGLLAALALACILLVEEATTAPAIRPVILGLAGIAAGTTWLAAIVGVLTAAWRAV